ncbi:hypothetical protein BC342_30855 [Streptomyces olivaceus]|nr:hypothetical protein BC342_30855 [Streptomyces olivaceus]
MFGEERAQRGAVELLAVPLVLQVLRDVMLGDELAAPVPADDRMQVAAVEAPTSCCDLREAVTSKGSTRSWSAPYSRVITAWAAVSPKSPARTASGTWRTGTSSA